MFFDKKSHYSFSHIDSFKVCEKVKRTYEFLGKIVNEEYDARYDEYDSDGNKLIYSFSLEKALNYYNKKNRSVSADNSIKENSSTLGMNSIFRKDALNFIENFFEYKYIQNLDNVVLFNVKYLTDALKMINVQYYLKQKNEECKILRYEGSFYKSNDLSISAQELIYDYGRLSFKFDHRQIIDDLVSRGKIIPLLPSNSDSKEFILKYCDLSKDYFSNIYSLRDNYGRLYLEKDEKGFRFLKMFSNNDKSITKQAVTFRKAFIDLLKLHVSKERRDEYCFFTDYSNNCYCDDCFKYFELPKEKKSYYLEEKSKYMSDFLSIPIDLIFQMAQKIKEYTESIKSKIVDNKFLKYMYPCWAIFDKEVFSPMVDFSICKSLDEIAYHTKKYIDMSLSLEDGMNELMSNADPRIRNFYNYLNENCVENQNKFKSGYQIMKEMSDWLGELLESK